MKPYFSATRSALNRITETFDLISPVCAALWNLRWQVNGFVAAVPDAGVPLLAGRFIAGTGMNWRNLRRACIDHTWAQQEEQLAGILLTSAFAIYESWCEDMTDLLPGIVPTSKPLQFPSGVDPTGQPTGAAAVLARIQANPSAALKLGLHPTLCQSRKYSLPKIEALLLCYRYFKEARNSLMHRGGEADQKAVDAYVRFSAVATKADLGLAEVPQHLPVLLDQPVKLCFRGVVGFFDILIRLMVTWDAELATTLPAESELARRWSVHVGFARNFKSDPAGRARQISHWISKLGLPPPADPAALQSTLRAQRLAF